MPPPTPPRSKKPRRPPPRTTPRARARSTTTRTTGWCAGSPRTRRRIREDVLAASPTGKVAGGAAGGDVPHTVPMLSPGQCVLRRAVRHLDGVPGAPDRQTGGRLVRGAEARRTRGRRPLPAGRLERLITRGDGTAGEDVSHAIGTVVGLAGTARRAGHDRGARRDPDDERAVRTGQHRAHRARRRPLRQPEERRGGHPPRQGPPLHGRDDVLRVRCPAAAGVRRADRHPGRTPAQRGPGVRRRARRAHRGGHGRGAAHRHHRRGGAGPGRGSRRAARLVAVRHRRHRDQGGSRGRPARGRFGYPGAALGHRVQAARPSRRSPGSSLSSGTSAGPASSRRAPCWSRSRSTDRPSATPRCTTRPTSPAAISAWATR